MGTTSRRKAIGIAALALMSLTGCAKYPKEATTEKDGSEEKLEKMAAAIREMHERDKIAVKAFLSKNEFRNIVTINKKIGSMITALENSDSEAATELNSEIVKLADEVIELQDVPGPVEKLHKITVQTAKDFRDCANYYAQSASAGDVSVATSDMDKGTEKLKSATENANRLDEELEKVKKRFNI